MEKLFKNIFAGAIAFYKRWSWFWTSKLETNGTLTFIVRFFFLIGYKNIDVNAITSADKRTKDFFITTEKERKYHTF